MKLIQEAQEIIKNAKTAYKAGEITAQQFCDATRIPMKDMFLTLYANGETSVILSADIYEPFSPAPTTGAGRKERNERTGKITK